MNKKIEKIIENIFIDLYKESIFLDGNVYSWDYIKEHTINIENQQQKFFPFMGFYMDYDKFNDIINLHTQKLSKRTKEIVNITVLLGPSPNCNKDTWNTLKEKYDKFINIIKEDMSLTDIAENVLEHESSDLVISLKFSKQKKINNE